MNWTYSKSLESALVVICLLVVARVVGAMTCYPIPTGDTNVGSSASVTCKKGIMGLYSLLPLVDNFSRRFKEKCIVIWGKEVVPIL